VVNVHKAIAGTAKILPKIQVNALVILFF
jgi:hypothetical protein